MFFDDPYNSKDFVINRISKEERIILKNSLLNKEIKILVDEKHGLFTEHGFPVAVSYYSKKQLDVFPNEFYARVIAINPMVTIDDFPKNC